MYKHTDIFQSQTQVILPDIIHIHTRLLLFDLLYHLIRHTEYFYKSQIILEKCFGKNYFLIQEFKILIGLHTLFKFTFGLLEKKL